MSGALGETERRQIPRWRVSRLTGRLGELRSPHLPKAVPLAVSQELESKEREWQASPTRTNSVELVALGILANQPNRSLAAAELLMKASPQQPALRVLALANIDLCAASPGSEGSEQLALEQLQPHATVALLKRRLIEDPRDSIAWCDLALQYSILGQSERARRAITIALRTAPDNRFVLRAATTFYVHEREPDRAHRLLGASHRLTTDPWLMAAEIGVAPLARRTPRALKAAQNAVDRASIPPFHLAELQSAMGTLEFLGGDNRRSRWLFRQSLIDPTENTVAQAEWASRRLSGFELQPSVLDRASAFEARARVHYERGEWSEAVAQAWAWLMDQPFAGEPAAFGSCIAAMCLEDYDGAVRFARFGLQANSSSAPLLNNLAIALAEVGALESAWDTIRRISTSNLPTAERVTVMATTGLIEFRSGDFASGRALYLQAIAEARAARLLERQALAGVVLARELLRVNAHDAAAHVESVLRTASGFPNPLVAVSLSKLRMDATAKGLLTSSGQSWSVRP